MLSQSVFPFYIHGGQKNSHKRGGQKFYTGSSGNNDVGCEKEEDVSKARKLSTGARILKGP